MTKCSLILAAHGSGDDSPANALVRNLARELSRHSDFEEVVAAFNLGTPRFSDALDVICSQRVIVVPVMTSDGYFCETVLPRELVKSERFAHVDLQITPSVGTHPGMNDIVSQIADRALQQHKLDPTETAIILIGHGTTKHPRSSHTTTAICDHLRSIGTYARVEAAFLDQDPLIENMPERLSQKNIIAIPFLLGGGHHAMYDIPTRLGLTVVGENAAPTSGSVGNHYITVTEAVGSDPAIADIILDLAREAMETSTLSTVGSSMIAHAIHAEQADSVLTFASHRKTLRLGTRGSAMALWQARHVASLLIDIGCDTQIVEISTSGDRDLTRPISALTSTSPFADDIETALLRGEIDIAVHCRKDLPVALTPGLVLAAILPRGDAREALVSRTGATLIDLPHGASVATSCVRRAAQIRILRPDIQTPWIRGPVDDRVRQVKRGDFDGAILALAGLQRLNLQNDVAELFSIEEFVPAPAQAVLAIQVRASDASTHELLSQLDHLPTRKAIETELNFFQPFENRTDITAAAYATAGDVIQLYARLMTPSGRVLWAGSLEGVDPVAAASDAHEQASQYGVNIAEIAA